LLFKGETHVAVTFFAGHLPPKPPWWFESATTGSIRKFHLRNDKTRMSPAIDIDFNQQTFARDFVTYLSQSPSGRARPEGCKLFGA